MATALVLAFKATDGRSCNIRINNPREDVTRDEVIAVMEDILDRNVFETSTGAQLGSIDTVYRVVTTKSEVLV